MANRKVLINRHTSGSTAPNAAEMYKGEIAVAHETGKETLWTKNNANEMVPFISCAQTITIIDDKIKAVNVVYDVKKGENEPHIEVERSQEGSAVTFTLTSDDIESKAEFEAYSAATKVRIDTNASAITNTLGILSALTDVVVTGITGDDIITATPVENGTGSNSYNLTHKTATAVTGFNKLDTDAYGHVTAATAVAASDIKALGFEDSAWTEEKIASAITALDSSISAATGKYFTALAIEDGKLVAKEEGDIPVLSVESAGTGNVVSEITVNDHKITYQTVSVATSEDIEALSSATQAFSAATVAEFTELSGATQAISGYAATQIAALSAGTIQLSADTKATIEQLSAGTIQLSADTYAAINQLSGYAHGEIAELSGAVQANETDIDNLSAATLDLSAVTLTGVSLNNTPLTVTDHVVSVPVTVSGSGIANATDSGSVADAKAVKEYVENVLSSSVDYKGATDSVPANPVKGDLWIASSAFTVGTKTVEVGDFIIYNGESWDVIEKNLDGAITGTLTQDTVVLGDSVNSAKSLANGASGQVLTIANGVPTWVDDPELSVVSAGTGNVLTDITVDDHEITFTKGITAASNADLQALSGAVEDFSGATDAKFIELSAYAKDVDDKVKALSAGTIQLSADTKAAIEQLSGFAHNSMIARDDAVFSSAATYADEKIAEAIDGLDSVGSASTTGHYLTSVTITDGKISAVGEVAVPAAVAITATTGAAVDTPSAVLTGVTADGTDNHNLTFGMSNKVFSAATSDSALTSESAITSVSATVAADAVHASAATKVDNALTVSGYSTSSASSLDSAIAYDGSEAKSLTFGTVGNAGLSSMSMTSAGLVDVEVIDCGEY